MSGISLCEVVKVLVIVLEGIVRTGSRAWMFDSGCAAVSVLDSRIGCAWTEMVKRTRKTIDVQVDMNGDGDMIESFFCVLCCSRL